MEALMKSPVILLAGLWRSIRRLEPDVRGLDRDIITIEKRFENEGYGFLTIALPSLGSAIDNGISSGWFTCPIGFKRAKGLAIPAFMQGMLCEVFDPFTGQLKEDASASIIGLCRKALYLFKKVQLESDQEDKLDRLAKAGFYQCDDIARAVILPSLESHLIGVVSSYMLKSLSSKDLTTASYKHGPGAVYEGLKGNQKWSTLQEFIRDDKFELERFGYNEFNVGLCDLSQRVDLMSSSSLIGPRIRAPRRTAKLISVPKNSTSRRTITVEPLLNQFIQQGLNTILRDSILECGILRNSLALTDQTKNQQLALEGSLHDNWATIDLKSASDLLSVELVKAVFSRHPEFLRAMMDCRSTSVTDGLNTVHNLGKFAGMGNALTFPVQSICFTVTCIAAILSKAGKKPSYQDVERASRCVRVYGDDIIVAKDVAHLCVNWLTNVGLKINMGKSFLTGNFKESCGVDAYKGVLVTPIYMRFRPDTPSTEPNTIASLVSTANQLWMDCLYEPSAILRNEVEERLGKTLPLVSRDSGVLGWHSRQDTMFSHRWNKVLQRHETRAFVLTSLKRKDELDGWAALLKFFHVPLLGRAVGHLRESSIRFKSRIAVRWVPTRVG
jgi:hypothetical protein